MKNLNFLKFLKIFSQDFKFCKEFKILQGRKVIEFKIFTKILNFSKKFLIFVFVAF